MIAAISILLFLIFLSISLIHFYWAFGGKWGGDSVIPTKKDGNTFLFNPGIFATVIVAFGLLSFGIFVLIKSGLIIFQLPDLIDRYGLWMIASIFLLRAIGDFNYVGFFKKIKDTKFGKNDTNYFSPLCLLIGLLTIILEFNLI